MSIKHLLLDNINPIINSVIALGTLGAAYYAHKSAKHSEQGISLNFLPILEVKLNSSEIGPNNFSFSVRNISKESIQIANDVKVFIRNLNYEKVKKQLLAQEAESFQIADHKGVPGETQIEINYLDLIGKKHLVVATIHLDHSRQKPQPSQISSVLIK